MFSICRCLNSRRVEGDEDSKPDFIEWSILSGLCLLNNNILQTIAAPEIEQNTVNRLSVRKIIENPGTISDFEKTGQNFVF